MKFSRFFTIFATCFILLAAFTQASEYGQELEEAGQKLKTIIKQDESAKDIQKEFAKYIAGSATGRSLFLALIQISHEILNEPEVKKLLDFLTENDIDVMKLSTLTFPPGVYEAIKEGSTKESPAPSFPTMDEVIDMPKAVNIGVELLQENSAAKKVFSFMSEPAFQLGVYDILSNPIYDETYGKLGKQAKGFPLKRITQGLTKMLMGKRDKRSLSEADRFIEGMNIILDCKKYPENSGCKDVAEHSKYSHGEL